MAGLYHRSLQEISQQEKRGGGRSSPYTRSSPTSRPSSDDRWQHDLFANKPRDSRDRQTASDVPTQKLLVENLHYEVTNPELEGLFQQIGPTEKCFIRFDRSGRSTGAATVIYKSVSHAIEAKREYDGANAKGQPIKISYEFYREFAPRGLAGAPTGPAAAQKGPDLLSRLGGGDLSARIGGGPPAARGQAPPNAPRQPAVHSRPGPQRTVSGGMGDRGSRGRGGSSRGRGGGRGRGEGRGPAPTASNLDAELDAFMKAPSSADKPSDADVDMA